MMCALVGNVGTGKHIDDPQKHFIASLCERNVIYIMWLFQYTLQHNSIQFT